MLEQGANSRSARSGLSRLGEPRWLWLSIFGLSLGLFLVRFLIPTPVGQADNRDGPRLMCGALGLKPVVRPGYPHYFSYTYFEYVRGAHCGRAAYVTSELVPLELARLLTPAFGLRGALNLVALGVVMCVIASLAIASLALGLRIKPWAQALVAAGLWLIVADSTFFDVFASPYSEPAALVGLLLVAAGLLYLGRYGGAHIRGLVLTGIGALLVILAKEEYLVLAVPICVTLVLVAARRGDAPRPGERTGLRRFGTRQARAAIAVAAVLAVTAVAYQAWNMNSPYGRRTQPMRVVDTIFEHIVNPADKTKAADLASLGLPAGWARYAGTYYWSARSVRNSPLYGRYEPTLTDMHMVRYFLTHPGQLIHVGQEAASEGMHIRVTYLGNYAPSAGRPNGALDTREIAYSWLAERIPASLGLLWLIPLWLAMAAIALVALRRKRMPWHRDAATVVLCMTGCAAVGFVPAAYFDGIESARHMEVMNLAIALAFAMSVVLAASMIYHTIRRERGQPARGATSSSPGADREPIRVTRLEAE